MSGEIFLKSVLPSHAAKAELDENEDQRGDENEEGDLDAFAFPPIGMNFDGEGDSIVAPVAEAVGGHDFELIVARREFLVGDFTEISNLLPIVGGAEESVFEIKLRREAIRDGVVADANGVGLGRNGKSGAREGDGFVVEMELIEDELRGRAAFFFTKPSLR